MAGEGSIFHRADGKWIAQLSTGGRNSRSYRTRTCATRREAVDALDELKAERRAGIRPSKQSLGDYLRWWLDESAKPSISANTYRGYEDVLAHLEPIAGIALRDVRAEDIEAVCNRMTVRRGKVALPASPKTVRNAQLMLRSALGTALERGYVARNVARSVKLRRVPRQTREALTPEMAAKILAAVAGDRYEAAYALAMIGLREGETLGLSVSDVDLHARTVTLRAQLIGSGISARRAQLKTAASEAPVPLPPFVVERLAAHLERLRNERPVASLDGGLLFVTPRGYAVNGSWLTKHFQALLAKAGLPKMRLHDLRHGAASLLVGAGAHPRIAQELLRHASSKTTMDIYSHVTAAQQREAADLLDAAISHAISHANAEQVGQSG